jgi:2-octaprenyl-6-methoxyphenol hydroxylase
VHLARGLGLFALKTLGPLRRAAIREGLQPTRDVPVLLQPDGARLIAARAAPRAQTSAA